MKTLIAILSLVMLSACAPLYPHNTLGEDVGEITLRIVGCPLTLCVSELMLHEHRRNQAKQEAEEMAYQERKKAYRAWYKTLSPQEKDREDRRSAHEDAMLLQRAAIANQALQNMRMGGPMLQYTPPPRISVPSQAPMPQLPTNIQSQTRQSTTCISRTSPYGGQVYTECN